MLYDLNFWPEPDWEKESSLNPFLLLTLVFVTLGVGAMLVFAGAISRDQFLKRGREKVKDEIAELETEVLAVRKKTALIEVWQKAMQQLELREDHRVLWCRQLESLHQIVPPEMDISELALSSKRVDPPPVPGAAKAGRGTIPDQEKGIAYRLVIKGGHFGEEADAMIARFANDLRTKGAIAEFVASPDMKITGDDTRGVEEETPGKRFEIICPYEPLYWKEPKTNAPAAPR